MTVPQTLFTFEGRLRRRDYWLKGALILGPISLLLTLSQRMLGGGPLYVVLIVLGLACLYPMSAVFVKRLHDRDRSGWLAIVPIVVGLLRGALAGIQNILHKGCLVIPDGVFSVALVLAGITLIGAGATLWIFIPLAFFRGTIGDNRFGSDPVQSLS